MEIFSYRGYLLLVTDCHDATPTVSAAQTTLRSQTVNLVNESDAAVGSVFDLSVQKRLRLSHEDGEQRRMVHEAATEDVRSGRVDRYVGGTVSSVVSDEQIMSMTINQPTTTTTKTTTMSSLLGWTGGQLHCQRVVRQFDTIVTIEGNQFRYCAEYLFNTQPHITAVTRSKVVGYV